jgi:hypothetical protein
LERENKQTLLQLLVIQLLILFQISQKNEHFPEFPSKINNFPEKDSEMDSEMSSCCCFLLRLLFVQKTAHARGGCQGASGFVHSDLFDVGGYPFFEANLGTLFFTPKCNFEGKWLPK